MRLILDSHSNIACPPESSFIVQLSRVYEIKRALEGLLHMGFKEEDVLEQMRVFCSHFFEQYMRRKGRVRWADKTPHYVDYADTIDKMYEGAVVYIGMVRHGLDVAYSLQENDWGMFKKHDAASEDKPTAAVRFWRDQNKKLLAFQERVGDRFHLVRYEELTQSPEKALKGVFEFLTEPWEEKVLDYHEMAHDNGFGDRKAWEMKSIRPVTHYYKSWPEKLLEKLYREAEEVFVRLKYSL
jgi:hypothetical protein